jgi:pimeloyl-ACP methyl ester carboxylesterase
VVLRINRKRCLKFRRFRDITQRTPLQDTHPFLQKLDMTLRLIGLFFALFGRIAPGAAGRLAHWLFRSPADPALTPEQRALLPTADAMLAKGQRLTVQHMGRTIVGHIFQPEGPPIGAIALLHGWMSGARFMMAYVEPLNAAGYTVLAMDAPGHGASGGKLTTGRDSTGALHALIEAAADDLPFGLTGAIGHSFGGAVAAFSSYLGHPQIDFRQHGVVLVSVPNEMQYMADEFSKAVRLPPRAQAVFEREAAAELGMPMEQLTGVFLFGATRPKMLQLHDPEDIEISFEQGAQYAALGPQVELREVYGVGHRTIIYDEVAVAAAVAFFRDQA